ncbi:SPFH domain-containing protein [Lachnospiraceae bacterium 42-17]|jgi:flotillin|nr:flotillin family protein [Dorea sp.]
MLDYILGLAGTLIPIALIVLLVILILATGYVKASPDTAYIISGLRKKPKVLIGKAGIKIPFLEKKDELNLQLIPIDVKTSSAVPTADYINIRVDAAVNVKISDNEERLGLAAQNFLNKPVEYIAQVSREVLEGNMREIVGKMNLEEMVSDRQKFATLVKENAEPDLAAMGLDIVSFNVQNFVDGNGVIENLGVDNIVKIQKNAAISRAESEKEIARAQAIAKKEANDAQVSSELEIANARARAQKEKAVVQAEATRESKEAEISAATLIAQKENELEIRKAELQKDADTKKAIADAAYQIQKESERKTVEITTADANLAKQEKAIILKEKEVELTERSLEATVKKQADAEKYAKQQESDANLYEVQRNSEAKLFERQKNAEAEKFEREKEAEALKATAEAQKFAMEQEAEGIRSKGLAEAEAIKAKALAEAEGIEKKAEAMKQMGEAAILEMYFKAMPEIARNIAEPLSKVDKITMYGDGNSSKLVKDIVGTLTQVTDGLKESTGVDLQSVLSGFLGMRLASGVNGEDTVSAAEPMSEMADESEMED